MSYFILMHCTIEEAGLAFGMSMIGFALGVLTIGYLQKWQWPGEPKQQETK